MSTSLLALIYCEDDGPGQDDHKTGLWEMLKPHRSKGQLEKERGEEQNAQISGAGRIFQTY